MLLCVGNHWQPGRCYRDLVACGLIHLWGGRLFRERGKESKCPGLQKERASEFITKVHQLVALMNFQVAKAAKCVIPCSNQGDLQLFSLMCLSADSNLFLHISYVIGFTLYFWKCIKCWIYVHDLHASYLKYYFSPSIFTISMCFFCSFSCYVYRDKLSLLLERNASHVLL